MRKLDACKSTRKIASQTLFLALKNLLSQDKPISEIDLRDRWLEELRKHKSIFPDGWYIPPPHGITVLFGSDNNTQRVSPSSLRLEEYWPSKEIFLDRNQGIILAYASPVDRKQA